MLDSSDFCRPGDRRTPCRRGVPLLPEDCLGEVVAFGRVAGLEGGCGVASGGVCCGGVVRGGTVGGGDGLRGGDGGVVVGDGIGVVSGEGGAKGAAGGVTGLGIAEGGEEGKVVARCGVGAVGGLGASWVALAGGDGVETQAQVVALGWEWFGCGFLSPMELASGGSSLSGDW